MDERWRRDRAETPAIVCCHVIWWIVGVLIGNLSSKDCDRTSLTPREVSIWVKCKNCRSTADRGSVTATACTRNGKPRGIHDIHRFAKSYCNVGVQRYISRAARRAGT